MGVWTWTTVWTVCWPFQKNVLLYWCRTSLHFSRLFYANTATSAKVSVLVSIFWKRSWQQHCLLINLKLFQVCYSSCSKCHETLTIHRSRISAGLHELRHICISAELVEKVADCRSLTDRSIIVTGRRGVRSPMSPWVISSDSSSLSATPSKTL